MRRLLQETGFEMKECCEQKDWHCARGMNDANDWIVPVCGNHDNLACFDGGQQFRHKRSGAVPDYTILPACWRTIPCVGGGISKRPVLLYGGVGDAPDSIIAYVSFRGQS